MKILLVKPDEYAVEAEIENGLRALQKAVDGNIEVFRPKNDPVVYIFNEEGKIQDLDYNRAIHDNKGNVVDIIAGTFLVCGVKGEDFVSLSPELMEKYKKQFFEPETFIRQDGKIMAIKVEAPKPIAEQLAEAEKKVERGGDPAADKKKNIDER